MSDFKFNVPKIDISNFDLPKAGDFKLDLPQMDWAKLEESANKAVEERLQREVESHQALLKIADNTQGINDLVSLVRQGNDINQQTFALLQEMQTIMTAQSPEEAETIFHEVMSKATQAKENIDTLQSLLGYGKMLGKIIFPESGLFD